MPNQWGGPRPNAGRKPGQKNKTEAQGRGKNIIKQATFTPDEWETIAGDMEAEGFKSFTKYCCKKLLSKPECSQLNCDLQYNSLNLNCKIGCNGFKPL